MYGYIVGKKTAKKAFWGSKKEKITLPKLKKICFTNPFFLNGAYGQSRVGSLVLILPKKISTISRRKFIESMVLVKKPQR